MTERRIASIWLPALAIERWAKSADSAPDSPVVLTVEGTHGPVIHAVTRAAAERGAHAGARLTDARALDPALVALPADPEGDAALLKRLAHWATRWSPVVEVDGEDSLRLDVSGVAHLFGGERRLAGDIEDCFAAAGFTSRAAIAPTASAAWALSHYGRSSSIVTPASRRRPQVDAGLPLIGSRRDAETQRGRGPHQRLRVSASPREIEEQRDSRFRGNDGVAAALAPLPVAALRLPPEAVRTLERLGLKTIGTLAGIERRSLARRFREADNPVDALDRALGRKPEPLTAIADETPPVARLRLEEPATHPEAAAQALERLIPPLVRQLEQRHLGARRLTLSGFRVDGSVGQASVATSIPSREPKHLHRLLAGVMESGAASLDPEFGFDAFALSAEWTERLMSAQDSLVEQPGGEQDLARLVDRLTVKLGPRRVRRPVANESHLPERASGWAGAVLSPSPPSAGEGLGRGGVDKQYPSPRSRFARVDPLPQRGEGHCHRPHHLLDRPEAIDVIYATPEGMPRRFVWRRAVHDIARAAGPERIAPEWWREPSSARLRDYYRVEDTSGRRFWIYREGVIGDGRGGVPNWFMHGLFG